MANEETLGSLTRTCRAATLLLHPLGNEVRVLRAFDLWCAERNITTDRFQQAWKGSAADRDRLIATAWANFHESRACLASFVKSELAAPLPWLPSALARTFVLWIENGVRRERRHTLVLLPDGQSEATLPPGRAPRDTLALHVEWYYRLKLKSPPDHVSVLATEYERRFKARSPAHSTIIDARDRVHQWLNREITFAWDLSTSY